MNKQTVRELLTTEQQHTRKQISKVVSKIKKIESDQLLIPITTNNRIDPEKLRTILISSLEWLTTLLSKEIEKGTDTYQWADYSEAETTAIKELKHYLGEWQKCK